MKASTIAWSAYTAAVIVFSATLALFVFAFVMALPRKVGAFDYLQVRISENPAMTLVALPLSIAFLVAPFYAAKWTYRGILNAGTSLPKRINRRNEN